MGSWWGAGMAPLQERLRLAGADLAEGLNDLREVVGTTRRILVPLLEKLDKEGFTRRDGDFRTLRQ